MAGASCAFQVQGCALRVARLAADGSTPASATGLYVTDQFTKVSWSDEIQAGQEITVTSACGANPLEFKDADKTRWGNITIGLTREEYELMELMLGELLVLTGADTRGLAANLLGYAPTHNGVSVEVWSKRIINNSQDATRPWVQTVFPKCIGFVRNERTIENGPFAVEITGRCLENPLFLNGPMNDWLGPTTRWWAKMEVAGPLPTVACGYQAVPVQA